MKRAHEKAAPSPLEAVIFDMDGVLIDSEPIHLEATHEMLAGLGIDYAPGLDENFYGCTDREVFRALRVRYNLDVSEIEDSQNGLSAAVAAGIRCVAVPCRSTAAQDFSRAVGRLKDLTELPGWIARSLPER